MSRRKGPIATTALGVGAFVAALTAFGRGTGSLAVMTLTIAAILIGAGVTQLVQIAGVDMSTGTTEDDEESDPDPEHETVDEDPYPQDLELELPAEPEEPDIDLREPEPDAPIELDRSLTLPTQRGLLRELAGHEDRRPG